MPKISSNHVIRFEKLSQRHASLLLRKYLQEYRIKSRKTDQMFPFDERAIKTIGELSEYNAARILKTSNELLEKATDSDEVSVINSSFVKKNLDISEDESTRQASSIKEVETMDLQKKAKSKKS